MNSFQVNGMSKIQKEIAKALNFEDISKKAMGSAIIRLNSMRSEQPHSEESETQATDGSLPTSNQCILIASPTPQKDSKPSAANRFVNENRVLHVAAAQEPMTTAVLTGQNKEPYEDLKVGSGTTTAASGNNKNRRQTEIAKKNNPTKAAFTGPTVAAIKATISVGGGAEEARLPALV